MILVIATAVFVACEYIAVRVKGYPHKMHLLDQQYRIIPIHLVKLTTTHLHITRRDTGRFFIYKIEDLHLINRWRIHLYPITSSLGVAKKYTNTNSHAEQTLATRDRWIEATQKLQAKIETAESDVLVRSLEQRLAGNLTKIRDLETRLDSYDIDYRPYENVDDSEGLVERILGLLDRIANRDDPFAE